MVERNDTLYVATDTEILTSGLITVRLGIRWGPIQKALPEALW